MRALFRPLVHHLKWPVRVGAFIVQFLHHLAAFFAWIWMLVHMIGALAQAGLQASKIWEMRLIENVWNEGLRYFSTAGGIEWHKILGFALIPACVVALRNSYQAYEQFRHWVKDHRAAQYESRSPAERGEGRTSSREQSCAR
jgi:hypothetical protein